MPETSMEQPLSEEVWRDALNRLRLEHVDVFASWFHDLTPGPLRNGQVLIYVESVEQLDYLQQNATAAFADALRGSIDRLVSVAFELLPPQFNGTADGSIGSTIVQTLRPQSLNGFEDDSSVEYVPLNSDYTFPNFIVGPSNRMAHATAIAVASQPGQTYNPLFIHGSVGLGKTHLLQAICQQVRRDRPDATILFLSCETFINHYVDALQKGIVHQFRFRYRHVDMLVIDDIQFLAAKEQTQEEFFHTFNQLYRQKKQIVISADTAPGELKQVEDRLVSRFNWGLVARIEEPCYETRLAILKKKAAIRDLDVPDDVMHYVAERVTANVRELEGVINSLLGMSLLHDGRVTMGHAEEFFGQRQTNGTSRELTVQDIIAVVTRHYNVKPTDLQGKRRTKSLTLPRHVCMHLARKLTMLSYGEIGGYFGNRDHTTVMHACKTIDNRLATDAEFPATIESLKRQILQRREG